MNSEKMTFKIEFTLVLNTDRIAYFVFLGRKQDVWLAVDPETGEKRRKLTMDGIGKMCPPMGQMNAPLYIGRTGMYQSIIFYFR